MNENINNVIDVIKAEIPETKITATEVNVNHRIPSPLLRGHRTGGQGL